MPRFSPAFAESFESTMTSGEIFHFYNASCQMQEYVFFINTKISKQRHHEIVDKVNGNWPAYIWTNAKNKCGPDQTGQGLSLQKPAGKGSETLKSGLETEIYSAICLEFTARTICIHQ